MASLEHTLPQSGMLTASPVHRITFLIRLRLVAGLILLLVGLSGLLGFDWDIQWHSVIGRDRTFTPPHDMLLSSLALGGIIALGSILIETWLARRSPDLRAYSTEFAGVLHSSLGSYLVGFGAVCAGVGLPLDTYWHSLYGIDVSLWAPFHIMSYTGGLIANFGVLYLLLSAAHLSQLQHRRWSVWLSYAGLLVELGLILSKLSTFLTPALAGNELSAGPLTLSFFPALLALIAVFLCILTVRLVPWTGAASMTVLAFLLIFLLVRAFVPPAMSALVQAEHETYRAQASSIGSTLVALLGQTPLLLLVSLSLDSVVWLGRRNGWKGAKQYAWELVAALVSTMLVAGFILVALHLAVHPGDTLNGTLALDLALALLLVLPTGLLSGRAASTLSKSLQILRR